MHFNLVISLVHTDRFLSPPRSPVWRESDVRMGSAVSLHAIIVFITSVNFVGVFLFCFLKKVIETNLKIKSNVVLFIPIMRMPKRKLFFDMLQVPLWCSFKMCLPIAIPDTLPTQHEVKGTLLSW